MPWTEDRKIPAAIILALIVQTAGLVWWAAKLDSKVEQQRLQIEKLEQQRDGATLSLHGLDLRLARLETRADQIIELLRPPPPRAALD